MRRKSVPEKEPATQVVKNIRRATRRHFSAEDNIRIVLEGLRGNAWQRSRGSAATARLLLINSSFSLGAEAPDLPPVVLLLRAEASGPNFYPASVRVARLSEPLRRDSTLACLHLFIGHVA